MKSKFKKATAVLLAVVMMLCALCVGTVGTGAAESVVVEMYEDYLYTVLEDGTVEIVGYEGDDTQLVIPDVIDGMSVSSIGDNAFNGCETISAVMIPDSVIKIGSYAFLNCSVLEGAVILGDVSSIGSYAFGYSLSNGKYTKADAFIIIAYAGTMAEEYASDNGFMFIVADPIEPPYDSRTELEMQVEYSSWIDEEPIESLYEEYGQENVDAYIAAVEKAKALLADENATEEELRAMVEELQAAEENLYMNYDPRTELMELLESLSYYFDQEPEYWYEIYTKESYDALLAAKEKAEMLLADENATDDQFLEVIDELNMAESNLVYLNGPSFSGGKIYWECPWSNVKVAYCHVFSSYGNWLYDWQTQYEKMTNEGGNLWSYEIPEGPYDLVIFSVDTGAQTYELVLTDENVGDTAISDFKVMLENPIDSNKTGPKTTWKSGVNGAHLTITSTGNIVGDKLCPTESGADAVAYFIGTYLPIQPLYVTSEVLKNAMNKFGTNQAEIVDVLEREFAEETEYIDEAKTLLGYVEGVSGDVTGDGMVKLTDAINIQKASLSMKSLTAKTTVTGDVNGDGKISVIDAILVQKMSLGMAA